MNKLVFKRFLAAGATVFTLALSIVMPATSVQAADLFDKACSGAAADSAVCQSKDEGATREDAAGRVQGVVNLMLYILGILAVIMIVIGGFRYVVSAGDEGGIKQGKNTIIYAVIGLIVAILAYAIVNFVVFRFQAQ